MLVLVIERYRGGHAAQVFERLRRRGRQLPDGLALVSSWVDRDFSRGFEVLESRDLDVLQVWTAQWADLIEFEIVPAYSGAEAFAIAADWESQKHLRAAPAFRPRQWLRKHDHVAELIIQSEEQWFDAAVHVRGEPTRLIGGAPTRQGAEMIVRRRLDALGHERCSSTCQSEWEQTVGMPDHAAS